MQGIVLLAVSGLRCQLIKINRFYASTLYQSGVE